MRRWLLPLLAGAALGAVFFVGARACRRTRTPPGTLVLVTIDTLRRDVVGAFVGLAPESPSPTPRLDALAREGLRFDDARTPVPLTLPAHTTLFSGLPPAQTGVRLNAFGRLAPPAARGFPLLAEALSAAGWRTAAFVSAEPLAALHGLDQGFSRYDDGPFAAPAQGEVPQRTGPESVGRALAWMRAQPAEERLFVWVHLFEPHAPYAALASRRAGYLEDVRAADAALGALLDGLSALGRGDAAVLVTSDHGEMLDELGEATHGHLLGDAVLRVPLVLRLPGETPGVRHDPVDLGDVAPTLAGLAGAAWPGGGALAGLDLLASPAPEGRIRVAESLYAHHRFRWAQLVAASSRTGSLVDVGTDRIGWLPLSPVGQPQTGLTAVTTAEPALVEALGAYKAGEQPERMAPGASSGGYGGAGAPEPFLSPEANAKLRDPYRAIHGAPFIDQARVQVRSLIADPRPSVLKAWAPKIERVLAEDPDNPELLFVAALLEEARASEADRQGHAPEVPALLERAEAAYQRAFEAGRRDADTLLRWAGVRAKGRAQDMLARIAAVGGDVPRNALLWKLIACLHEELGQAAQAAQALASARALVRTSSEQRAVEAPCR